MSGDPLERAFACFVHDRIKPAVDRVMAGRRAGLFQALGMAGAFFLLMATVMLVVLGLHRQLPGEGTRLLWVALLLVPATFAISAFALAYVLLLQRCVAVFRGELTEEIAAFIHPGVSWQKGIGFSQDDLAGSMLVAGSHFPAMPQGFFGGEIDGLTIRFGEVPRQKERDGHGLPSGLFFMATFQRPHPYPLLSFPAGKDVSLSGLEKSLEAACGGGVKLVRLDDVGGRQRVTDAVAPEGYGRLSPGLALQIAAMGNFRGTTFSLCCREGMLYALVSWQDGENPEAGIFEELNFDRMREFSRAAALCLAAAKELGASLPENP